MPRKVSGVTTTTPTPHREHTMKTTTRIATATLGLAAATGIALGAAGAAHAGTLPITRPGEPTVAMTITNHTDKPEYLQGANADGGQ
ncbi:hypothetical protein ACWFOS_07265, partial [Gordonia terrae]